MLTWNWDSGGRRDGGNPTRYYNKNELTPLFIQRSLFENIYNKCCLPFIEYEFNNWHTATHYFITDWKSSIDNLIVNVPRKCFPRIELWWFVQRDELSFVFGLRINRLNDKNDQWENLQVVLSYSWPSWSLIKSEWKSWANENFHIRQQKLSEKNQGKVVEIFPRLLYRVISVKAVGIETKMRFPSSNDHAPFCGRRCLQKTTTLRRKTKHQRKRSCL